MNGRADPDGTCIPFVVTQHWGGDYDDEAFFAGYHMGWLDRVLEPREIAVRQTRVLNSCLKQLDLICMRHGYSMKVLPWEPQPGYSVVCMKRGEAVVL